MIIELTLLGYCRYRQHRLRHHLARYPDYLLRDMGLRIEDGRVVADRDEPATVDDEMPMPTKRRTSWLVWWQALRTRN